MVPRGGIEPPTRGFSVRSYSREIKDLQRIEAENRSQRINGLSGKMENSQLAIAGPAPKSHERHRGLPTARPTDQERPIRPCSGVAPWHQIPARVTSPALRPREMCRVVKEPLDQTSPKVNRMLCRFKGSTQQLIEV